MPLRILLLSPNGRVNRQPYILWSIVLGVVSVVLQVLGGGLSGDDGDLTPGQLVFGALSLVWTLATIWPSLAIAIKRCHDRDRSGWFILVSLIPVVGSIWAFVELFCLPGTPGRNRFGPNPLQADDVEIGQIFS